MWYKFAAMAGSSDALSELARFYVGGEQHVKDDPSLDNSHVPSNYYLEDITYVRCIYPCWGLLPDIEKEVFASVDAKFPIPNPNPEGYGPISEDGDLLDDMSPYEIRGPGGTSGSDVEEPRGEFHYEVWHKGRWAGAGGSTYDGEWVGPERLLWKGAYRVVYAGPPREVKLKSSTKLFVFEWPTLPRVEMWTLQKSIEARSHLRQGVHT